MQTIINRPPPEIDVDYILHRSEAFHSPIRPVVLDFSTVLLSSYRIACIEAAKRFEKNLFLQRRDD